MRPRSKYTYLRSPSLEHLQARLPLAIDFGAFEHLSGLTGAVQGLSPAGTTVASRTSGSPVVVFEGRGPSDIDGVFLSAKDDVTITPRVVRVNETREGVQDTASIVGLENGSFVVVWHGRGTGDRQGVFARWFDASLKPITGEVLVNQSIQGSQSEPAIAQIGNNEVAIAWRGFGADREPGVQLRRFSATGDAVTDEISVSDGSDNFVRSPAVSLSSTGVAVVWTSENESTGDSSVRLRSIPTNSQMPEPVVSLSANNVQARSPSVVTKSDGNLLVAWEEKSATDSPWQIRAGIVGSTTIQPTTPVTLVSTASHQANVQLAIDSTDRVFAAWNTLSSSGTGWDITLAQVTAEGMAPSISDTETNPLPGRQFNAGVVALSQERLAYAVTGSSPVDVHGAYVSQVLIDAPVTGRLDLLAIPVQTAAVGSVLHIPLVLGPDNRGLQSVYRIDEDSSDPDGRIEQQVDGNFVFVWEPTAADSGNVREFTIVVTNSLGEVDQELIRVAVDA